MKFVSLFCNAYVTFSKTESYLSVGPHMTQAGRQLTVKKRTHSIRQKNYSKINFVERKTKSVSGR